MYILIFTAVAFSTSGSQPTTSRQSLSVVHLGGGKRIFVAIEYGNSVCCTSCRLHLVTVVHSVKVFVVQELDSSGSGSAGGGGLGGRGVGCGC